MQTIEARPTRATAADARTVALVRSGAMPANAPASMIALSKRTSTGLTGHEMIALDRMNEGQRDPDLHVTPEEYMAAKRRHAAQGAR